MDRESKWILSIGVDRLLHSFRNTSGTYAGREGGYMTVNKLGGWESLDCDLRGHTTGHIMSGLAYLYASTGDVKYKIKGDSIVKGLYEVQATMSIMGRKATLVPTPKILSIATLPVKAYGLRGILCIKYMQV